MKESSTRAFPNGLIPSPLARHVKIFTHWTSGGWRGVSKKSKIKVGWTLTISLTCWIIRLVGVDQHEAVEGWVGNCYSLHLRKELWKMWQNEIQFLAFLLSTWKYEKRNKRLTLVYLVPTISIGWKVNFSLLSTWKSVKGHPSIQETSSTAKRTWEYFLDYCLICKKLTSG